jgi:hypothetical protein
MAPIITIGQSIPKKIGQGIAPSSSTGLTVQEFSERDDQPSDGRRFYKGAAATIKHIC